MEFNQLEERKTRLDAMLPLNQAELNRIRDEFIIENTYHSNAIEGNSLTLRETAMILSEGITIAEKPLKAHLEAMGIGMRFPIFLPLWSKKGIPRSPNRRSRKSIPWC